MLVYLERLKIVFATNSVVQQDNADYGPYILRLKIGIPEWNEAKDLTVCQEEPNWCWNCWDTSRDRPCSTRRECTTVFLSRFGAFLTSLLTFAQQLVHFSKQLMQTAKPSGKPAKARHLLKMDSPFL